MTPAQAAAAASTLERVVRSLDELSTSPAHRGPASTVAACAAHEIRWVLETLQSATRRD